MDEEGTWRIQQVRIFDKIHMLSDCSNTSPEHKKELLKKRCEETKERLEQAKKQRRAKSVKRATDYKDSIHNHDDARFDILI